MPAKSRSLTKPATIATLAIVPSATPYLTDSTDDQIAGAAVAAFLRERSQIALMPAHASPSDLSTGS